MTTEEIAELAHYAETVYGMVVGDVNNKFWSTLSVRETNAYVEATRMRLVNRDMSVPEVDEVTGEPFKEDEVWSWGVVRFLNRLSYMKDKNEVIAEEKLRKSPLGSYPVFPALSV